MTLLDLIPIINLYKKRMNNRIFRNTRNKFIDKKINYMVNNLVDNEYDIYSLSDFVVYFIYAYDINMHDYDYWNSKYSIRFSTDDFIIEYNSLSEEFTITYEDILFSVSNRTHIYGDREERWNIDILPYLMDFYELFINKLCVSLALQ